MTKLQVGNKILVSGCSATIHSIYDTTVWLKFHTGECANHSYTRNGIEKGLVPLTLDFVLRNMNK